MIYALIIAAIAYLAGAIVTAHRFWETRSRSGYDRDWVVIAFVAGVVLLWPIAVPGMWLFVRAFSGEAER